MTMPDRLSTASATLARAARFPTTAPVPAARVSAPCSDLLFAVAPVCRAKNFTILALRPKPSRRRRSGLEAS
jgi:hypothetical protein